LRKIAGRCLLGCDCEHVRRQVQPNDLDPRLRQFDGDSARPDADLENVAARTAREIEEEGDVT
jgi:hypothetical protein